MALTFYTQTSRSAAQMFLCTPVILFITTKYLNTWTDLTPQLMLFKRITRFVPLLKCSPSVMKRTLRQEKFNFFAGTGIGIRPQPATSAQPSRLGLKCSSEILHSESREARAASFGKRQLRDGAAGTQFGAKFVNDANFSSQFICTLTHSRKRNYDTEKA